MLTFKTGTPSSCGIVEVDNKLVVQDFHEKVEDPPGDRANGALYAFDEKLLVHLKNMNPSPKDFSTEVIPELIGYVQTKITKNLYIDVGTMESLAIAQKLFEEKK